MSNSYTRANRHEFQPERCPLCGGEPFVDWNTTDGVDEYTPARLECSTVGCVGAETGLWVRK